MPTVVITGNTRGIGYALAEAFLARACRVVVNGRSQASVDAACASLSKTYGSDALAGCAGSVADLNAVEAVWETAVRRFKQIDIWINNAGLGHDMLPIWEIPPERVQAILDTNVRGVANGCRVAMQGMLQQGEGQIYNMEGFGSGGDTRDGLGIYGASKAAISYLTRVLISEARDTPVVVGSLRPGMVTTDMLLDPLRHDPAVRLRSTRIFNILADRPETVAPWLADQVLSNTRHGAKIQWLTRTKIMWRFLSAPFSRRNVLDD